MGKTTLAKQISERYGLLYVSPETIAADMTEELVSDHIDNFEDK